MKFVLLDAGSGKKVAISQATVRDHEFFSFLKNNERKFLRAHVKYCLLDESLRLKGYKHLVNGSITLDRNYYLYKFLSHTHKKCDSGNILCAGISFGTSALILSHLIDIGPGGRKWIFVDPMDGAGREAGIYNTDKTSILKTWNNRAPLEFMQEYLEPELCKDLPPLCFAHLNTGDADAESSSLPHILEKLLPSGCVVIDQYGRGNEDFRHAIDESISSFDCTRIFLQESRQLVIIKI